MSKTIFELMGLAGIFIFLAGLHQIWIAREEAMFWTERFLRIFTASLRQPEAAVAPAPSAADAPQHRAPRTLNLIGGFGLLALGSFLVLASLAIAVFA